MNEGKSNELENLGYRGLQGEQAGLEGCAELAAGPPHGLSRSYSTVQYLGYRGLQGEQAGLESCTELAACPPHGLSGS
jgi:hypothetical protein